ncbi:hypothetical protein HDU97_006309 [Phlyctochytrium planicorne]|nr:hypothetical protein HDU97_006309 [Phlyctochytrium planicorne]
MSTFSDPNFNTLSYRDYRPTYGDQLFQEVLQFHGSTQDVAVDVACGTGQATIALAQHFAKVIGVEPSDGMRKDAITAPNITYQAGDATSFNLPDDSADLVTVAQAAHWFDSPSFLKETLRVLKKTGTLAIWGYAYATVEGNEELSAAIEEWGKEKMSPYWDSRRKVLDDLYENFAVPLGLFSKVLRLYHHTPTTSPIQKRMSVATLESYMQTFSCYKTYLDHVKQTGKKEPDPIHEVLSRFYPDETKWEDTIVNVVWPTVIILAKV